LSDAPLPGARVRADEGRAASNGQATGEAGAAMTQAVGR
jgi:hypothetical protein